MTKSSNIKTKSAATTTCFHLLLYQTEKAERRLPSSNYDQKSIQALKKRQRTKKLNKQQQQKNLGHHSV